MSKKFLISATLVLVFVAVGSFWLHAAPQVRLPASDTQTASHLAGPIAQTVHTVGTASATPSIIVVNTPTVVTVTVPITDSALIPGSVNLLRLGPTGTQPTILGLMHDDGKNGDALAGDGVYMLGVAFNEAAAGSLQLEVSAAFQGFLKRITSPVISLAVYNAYIDPTLGLTFYYPNLPAPAEVVAYGGSQSPTILLGLDTSSTTFSSIFNISIFENPTHLSLRDWFSAVNDPNHILDGLTTVAPVMLPSGLEALFLTGAAPPEYTQASGSLAAAYVLSKDGSRVLSIGESDQNPLYGYGYTPEQVTNLVAILADTLSF